MQGRQTGEAATVREMVRAVAAEHGIPAYFVGGCVRDQFLDRASKDIDVVVEDDRAELLITEASARLGWRQPVVFARYGTYQSSSGGVALEVVRARAESYTLESRKPIVRK